MKNLLGKFHAELSQQRLASQAEPSQAKPSRERERCPFLVFCQENFMKNLLGKFHAESMPVLGLAQQVFPYKKSGTCSMVRICCHNTYNKNMTPVFIVFFLSKYAAYYL